ncbi:MAG: hypothetical protein OXU61_12055 [Gammaproteobacteria bacterium]|nr:hypothetical protein [Gammaproteobacteria bacterium]
MWKSGLFSPCALSLVPDSAVNGAIQLPQYKEAFQEQIDGEVLIELDEQILESDLQDQFQDPQNQAYEANHWKLLS